MGAAIGTAVASENKGDPVEVGPGMGAEILLSSPVEIAVVVRDGDGIVLAGNR